MITGELKNKIQGIWDIFWSSGMTNTLTVIEQITYLMFIKILDDNEIIKIRENSFEQIVRELQIYNLSTTSDDVKGIAFEQFLGRTFR